ncbi:MAG: hypothetical protein ACYCQJ_16315 [Nitrososphaerales archaeon]
MDFLRVRFSTVSTVPAWLASMAVSATSWSFFIWVASMEGDFRDCGVDDIEEGLEEISDAGRLVPFLGVASMGAFLGVLWGTWGEVTFFGFFEIVDCLRVPLNLAGVVAPFFPTGGVLGCEEGRL